MPPNGFAVKPLTRENVMGRYELTKFVLSHELTLLEPAARDKLSQYEPIARVLNRLNRHPIANAKMLANYTGDIFLHIASLRHDPEAISSIKSANDRLRYVRTVECEHPELVQKDLKRFCELLLAPRCEELAAAIHEYHEQRIKALPELLERL